MNKTLIFPFLFLFFLLTSCVPTRSLIYLQEKKTKDTANVKAANFKPYRLQTNDLLSISIRAIDPKLLEIFNPSSGQSTSGTADQGNYINGYSVDDHGNIRLPILGELNVLGYTTEEVRLKIEKLLLDKYFKPEAGIFVIVKLSGFRYTINGEIGNTGTQVLYQDRVNIMEAIANAGDITITGDRKNVKVIRTYPQGRETFTIDLTTSDAVNSPCFYLQPNDYILVNPLKQKTWGTGKTGVESLSTFITLLSLATTTYFLLKN